LNVDEDTLASVVGETTARRFAWLALVREATYLHRNKFPFPEGTVDRQHLETLVNLRVRESRVRYIDALASGKDSEALEQIVETDKAWPESVFSQEQERVIQSMKWRNIRGG
jgi:hypothetical protein